ncbi:MAG: VCBS repeat-containing protein [Planctomycetes bacterium]|nr:VCBS repeat-containing protein [Planctomycetota bacterium]
MNARHAIRRALVAGSLAAFLSGNPVAQQFRQFQPWELWAGADHLLDVNGDGAPDIIHPFVASAQHMTCAYRDGRALGEFGPSIPMPTPSGAAWFSRVMAYTPLDAEGDGDIDIVALTIVVNGATITTGPVVMWLNDGVGGFSAAQLNRLVTQVPIVIPLPFGLVSVDLNTDGYDDIFLIESPAPSRVLLNDGSGHFTELPAACPGPAQGLSLVLRDLDRDGDADLVGARLATAPSQQGFLWRNDGTGRFSVVSTPGLTSCDHVDSGDIDGDGDLDLVFATWTEVPVVWLNDGYANFSEDLTRLPPLPIPVPPPHRHSRVWLRDLDLDGDLDLVDGYAYQCRILINDGTGHFSDATMAWGMWTTALDHSFAADLDRDGDVDLLGVRGGATTTGVFFNLLRHAHSNAPVIGGNFDVEIDGSPGALAVYGIGFARRDVFVPGLGFWALDPALSVMWPRAELLDPTGAYRASWPVPSQAALRGVEIFVQGAVIEVSAPLPVRFTNLWRTAIR